MMRPLVRVSKQEVRGPIEGPAQLPAALVNKSSGGRR